MSPVLPAWLWLLALTPFAAPAMATQAVAAQAVAAQAVAAQAVAPASQCDQAAAAAERQYALPPGILAAIGRVESGRTDPASHALHPWPWSIDAGGAGSMAPTTKRQTATQNNRRFIGRIPRNCFALLRQQSPTVTGSPMPPAPPGRPE